MTIAAMALFAVVAWLTTSPAPRTAAAGQEPAGIFEEKQLGTLEGSAADGPVFWSPNGRSWAYRMTTESKKWVMVVDGRRSAEYESLGWPCFSPDSARVAFVTRNGFKARVVEGATQGEEFDEVGSIRFPSANSTGVVWAPDSHGFAYAARLGNLWFVVEKDRKEGGYSAISDLCWDPRTGTTAYSVEIRGQGTPECFVVADGKKGEEFDGVRNLRFAPEGGTLAYIAREGRHERLVVNGKKGPPFHLISEPFIFSPKGREAAYAARSDDGTWWIVESGNEDRRDRVGSVHGVQPLAYSPDGREIASVVHLRSGEAYEDAVRKGAELHERYDSATGLRFSPDGTTIAYIASRGAKMLVVVGTTEGEKFRTIAGLTFSPDGRSVAYRAERYGKHVVVAGSTMSAEFDDVLDGPHYSPDSRKVAFVVRQGKEMRSKVMDVGR